MSGYVVNPEAVGDPNQTPIVQLFGAVPEAAYVRITPRPPSDGESVRTIAVSPSLNVDVAADGRVIGVERIGGMVGPAELVAVLREITVAGPVPEDAPKDGLDLEAIRPWLAPCGSCDGGLPMSCSHPEGDYRVPMAALFAEVERLRSEYAKTVSNFEEFAESVAEQRAEAREGIRRYGAVVEAAKTWLRAAQESPVFRTQSTFGAGKALFALWDAVAALGDTGTTTEPAQFAEVDFDRHPLEGRYGRAGDSLPPLRHRAKPGTEETGEDRG
jgi:hypothetical protein